MCPTGRGETQIERGKYFMTFDIFKKIIDEVGEYLFEVDFYFWGEPLLNKDIFNMIEYAHKRNIRTRISTNFSFTVDFDRLIQSGLDEIIISCDGASEETYKIYRVGGNFQKVLRNMKLLADRKRELRSKNPEIIWQFLVMKHNEHEISKAKKMASEIGVKLRLLPIRAGLGPDIINDHKENKYISWLPKKITRYNKDGSRKFRIKSCLFLWLQTFVNADGSVSPCCGAFYKKDDMGNVLENGLQNVWNGGKYQLARAVVKNKLINENIICSECVRRGYFIDP